MDIVNRLRSMGGYLDYDHEVTLGSIADTIEQQQSEITRLTAMNEELNNLVKTIENMTIDKCADTMDEYFEHHVGETIRSLKDNK